MAKHSKATLALLAQFPTFDDWIINNLTPDQINAVLQSPFEVVFFGESHPLNTQDLGVQLWRAYRGAVLFELKGRWGGSDQDHVHPPPDSDPLSYFHQMVCNAIALFASEQPELLENAAARQRREIEAATGPAQPAGKSSGAAKRSKRL
jgi:hypothetical protein